MKRPADAGLGIVGASPATFRLLASCPSIQRRSCGAN